MASKTFKSRGALALLALAVAVVIGVYAKDDAAAAEDSAVHVLTTDNFDDFLKEHPTSLIEFYAPWCGHCKTLEPHYEEAAAKLKESGGIPLAKVDATAQTELATRYQVRGYPTIKFFKNGEPTDYTGGRTGDAIVSWIESVTGPAVKEIAETEAKAQSKGTLFVANVKKGSAAWKLYEAVAEELRMSAKFSVVISDSPSDEISVYRPDEEVEKTKIGTDKDALTKWVEKQKFPVFGPVDGETYAAYEARDHEMVWFAASEDDYQKYAPEFRQAAKNFRDSYSFVWLDLGKFQSHAENEGGLGLKNFPAMMMRLKSGGRYVYPEEQKFTAKEITKYFEDIQSGKIEKVLKSEPIPESNADPVKVVVGKNFNEMVFDSGKDVLLEVYAPWCGHCKRLEPVYNELAEKLEPFEHVMIAKMDGTVNEAAHKDFQIQGFPSIFWVKSGEDKVVPYDGGRTLEAMLKFVKENSSKPIALDLEESSESDNKDEL